VGAQLRRLRRDLLPESASGVTVSAEISQDASEGTEKQRDGRPGIDSVVYLKMLMVGFFEDLPSERADNADFGRGFGGPG
jgi:hypothetical protein